MYLGNITCTHDDDVLAEFSKHTHRLRRNFVRFAPAWLALGGLRRKYWLLVDRRLSLGLAPTAALRDRAACFEERRTQLIWGERLAEFVLNLLLDAIHQHRLVGSNQFLDVGHLCLKHLLGSARHIKSPRARN